MPPRVARWDIPKESHTAAHPFEARARTTEVLSVVQSIIKVCGHWHCGGGVYLVRVSKRGWGLAT